LYSPVSGEVLEVNKKIQDSPELVNKDPYEQGWMIKVKIEKASELDSLMNVDAYKKLVAK
jgi:glycine cleavage system H protein